jgi:prepilin-type N-terminal cleavage/methylation domain-containing protein
MDFTTGGRGFSMLEILAALTLITILAAVALPAWNRLLPAQHLASAARIVRSDLQTIKMHAVAGNVRYRFVYQNNAAEYSLEKDGDLLATKSLPNGVSITKAGEISFSPRGTANGNRVRLQTRDGSCQQIVVSPTGRVRTCKPRPCTTDC